MRGRLFLKIYLTVLGGIAILALAGGAALVAGGRGEPGLMEQRMAFLAAALTEVAGEAPSVGAGGQSAGTTEPVAGRAATGAGGRTEDNDSAARWQSALDRLGPASDLSLAVTDDSGQIVARYQPPSAEAGASRWREPMLMPLPDGHTLAVRFGGPRGGPLLLLLLVAGGTALAAWPVVRHLTRRLERLRRGVETWGDGELSVRVPVEGRDEIAAVAGSFNRAAAQIESLVTSHRTLLANASHELRSPLARLRLAVDLYGGSDDAAREEVLRNLAELDELVGEILLSSRLSHATTLEPLEPLDLLALVAEEASRSGLDVVGEPAEIQADPRLLARLLRNLIHNAQRHGHPPIEITVQRCEGMVELVVRDHGAGLPAEDGERLFEPFHRPGGYGEAAGGWGLGLALVRQIAERHGGSVRYDTPPDGGARFTVAIPLA